MGDTTNEGSGRTDETSDVAAIENAAETTVSTFLWLRTDVETEAAYDYWRDVHGVLAARVPGFYQYRQLRLGRNRPDFFPDVEGIASDVPAEDGIDGVAQVLYRSRDDMEADPELIDAILEDERNFLRRSTLHLSFSDDAHTYVDRTGEPVPQGAPSSPSFVVCFVRSDDSDTEAFRDHLKEAVARRWSAHEDVLRLRLHSLEPHDESAWNSPSVGNTYPSDREYAAWMELSLRDEDAARELFDDGEAHARHVGAVHTYPVDGKYTIVHDGKPTDVGLRGYPPVRTIEGLGAANQRREEVLELVYGGAVHGESVE